MGFAETIVFYLLIGVCISVAVFLVDDEIAAGERIFRTATAIVFWPVYLPILLRRSSGVPEQPGPRVPQTIADDEMSDAISQVDAELDTAINSLDGWAEDVLSRENGRLSELQNAWRMQADRIRELDRLLAQPEFIAGKRADRSDQPPSALEDRQTENDRILQCERSRRENIERLREVRQHLHDDLMGTLAWVRELVTMIHLAKFTGAPASRAEELVAQIAAAVEGMSEVTNWHEETLTAAAV